MSCASVLERSGWKGPLGDSPGPRVQGCGATEAAPTMRMLQEICQQRPGRLVWDPPFWGGAGRDEGCATQAAWRTGSGKDWVVRLLHETLLQLGVSGCAVRGDV